MTGLIEFPTSKLKVDRDDIKLILAVASLYYLYGKFQAALNITALAEHLVPEHQTTVELKIVLQTELQQYESVIQSCAAAKRLFRELPVEIVACQKLAERALQTAPKGVIR